MSQATHTDQVSNRLNPAAHPFTCPPSPTISEETIDVPVSGTDGTQPTTVVWKSFEIQQWERFIQLQYANKRNSKLKNPSPEPANFRLYISNRLRVLEGRIKRTKAAIAAKEGKTSGKDSVNIMVTYGGKNLAKATKMMIRAIPKITEGEDLANIVSHKEMGADAEFTERSELLVGKSLLEML